MRKLYGRLISWQQSTNAHPRRDNLSWICYVVHHNPQNAEKIWDAEIKLEIDGLKWKAQRLVDTLNVLPGISCTTAKGAMYVFPSLNFLKKAIKAASQCILDGRPAAPDMFWAWTLLHETGIVVVPGNGFGEVPWKKAAF
jgi:aspartate/methionine/tyrosine aminotransferase